ncbi:serine hydrolase domain-containing protein [Streptomyces sp. NPDC016845]|uniref:serine hydrolase domain-containing protein n=1 Tax=Streptomyces sp. NPDC016845 TaxID=3364972 RepID=UPI0037B6DFB5
MNSQQPTPRTPDTALWPGAARYLPALLSAAPAASAVAVGLHHDGRRTAIAQGTTAHHDGRQADASTRFEIGSVTKTFTALLLAEQAARGELHLHDPLLGHLPPGTRPPPGGSGIRLLHLATHTSGLPRLPPGLLRTALPHLLTNPYDGCTAADILDALSRTRLRSRPGTRTHYSNFGVGLLGHALSGAAGLAVGTDGSGESGAQDYASLLATRVLGPLGLHDTDCVAAPPDDGDDVTGYWHGRPRPPFRIPGMPAAGAVRSSARDLLTFTEALLDPDRFARATVRATVLPHSLRTALHDTTRPRIALRRGAQQIALVWNIRPRGDGSRVHHHSGGTRGCTAFAGFDTRRRAAVVALANCAPGSGNHLIQQAYDTLLELGDG